jgi:TldD protein
VGGVFAHELVGHALEGDVLAAGASWLASRERRQPSCPELVVVDDPRRGRAAWSIDDEGNAARPVALVRGGEIAGALLDRRTARARGAASNGRGRRSSYRQPVMPRMGCTFVAAGRLVPEEVLASVTRGVYIRSMEAASTDVRRGRAIFRVTDADAIRQGKLEFSLLPFLLTIDGAAALAGTERIASDLAFDTCLGSCVRAGQPMATSVGGPTFCIGSATITS